MDQHLPTPATAINYVGFGETVGHKQDQAHVQPRCSWLLAIPQLRSGPPVAAGIDGVRLGLPSHLGLFRQRHLTEAENDRLFNCSSIGHRATVTGCATSLTVLSCVDAEECGTSTSG